MSFTSLSVYGTARNPDQSVAAGAIIQLKLSAAISDGATDILPATIDEVSAGDGTFTFPDVTPNDDSTTTPTGTYYRVLVFSAAGVILDYFNTIIPHASAPSVNLFSLARINVAGQPAISYGVTSIDALTGPVTITSPDGSVTIGKTGQAITLEAEPGLAIGNAVSGAADNVLLAVDGAGKLADGPATSSVVSGSSVTDLATTALTLASTRVRLADATGSGAPSALALTVHGSGGTFAGGFYYWVVTNIGPSGESVQSNIVTGTLANNGSASFTWANAANATGTTQIYRATRLAIFGGAGPTIMQLVATVANGVTSYTDTGTATTAQAPPATNGGAFTETLPAATGSGAQFSIVGVTSGPNPVTVNVSAGGTIQPPGGTAISSITVGPPESGATYATVDIVDQASGWRVV